MGPDLSAILPRVLIVSRRTVRKNKFVDFVGEYHLDLIVRYGAVPVIVPRVTGVHSLLESFEPIHGVLLCEGEDIDPSLYQDESSALSPEELEEINQTHSNDTIVDKEKDSIEMRLVKLCLDRSIPYLGICRGSQILNLACGGTVYRDIGKELAKNLPKHRRVEHMNYQDYDNHRHPVRVVSNTPLSRWFEESLDTKMEIWVNSYHHQGVKRLAKRFTVMAFAEDGLVEGFYDPEVHSPKEGKFLMGLQFHPERMRMDSDEFDYPGCASAYQEFVCAVVSYQKKVGGAALSMEMERQRDDIVRSFSLARDLYFRGAGLVPSKESELQAGAEFLESNTILSREEERRLKQMGATVRKSSLYMESLRVEKEREGLARAVLQEMTHEQLSELVSFYHMMCWISEEVLEEKKMLS